MKKAKFSEKDNRGVIYVDCTECKRGINGTDENKCSSGSKIKKGKHGGCFSGDLLDDLEI